MSDDIYSILVYGEDSEDENRWQGVIPMLSSWFSKTESQWSKDFLGEYMTERTCGTCLGDRLNEKALSVYCSLKEPLPDFIIEARARLGLSQDPYQINIADFARLNIALAIEVTGNLKLNREAKKIAQPILDEIRNRLQFLASVGLEYLHMGRRMSSLSGGEAQRIRLATQVGSGIVGAAYVLDEPTIGLHPKDNTRLITTLRRLADIGNTVLVVEHDEEMIRAADHVIDIGPGPGVHGGQVVAQGTIEDICKSTSLTGQYLSGQREVPLPEQRRPISPKKAISICGARENNLKDIDVDFPLGGLVVVTGVSGSGKSTLVNDILLKAAKKHLHKGKIKPGQHDSVEGLDDIARIIEV